MQKNKELIENMTVEQKLAFLAGGQVDGLPFFSVSALESLSALKPDSAYPSFNGLANCWDGELIGKISADLCSRMEKQALNVALSPHVGVKLSPYGSGMSEDPYLCSKLAKAYKKGIAQAGAMPVLAGCALEQSDCDFMDAQVDKAIIRDYIVRPFEAASASGYNAIQTSDLKLQGNYGDVNCAVVRRALHDKSFVTAPVVCDCRREESAAERLAAGELLFLKGDAKPLEQAYRSYTDLQKAETSGSITKQEVENACRDGKALSEKAIDAAVGRFLHFADECGKYAAAADPNCGGTEMLSVRASAESIVLLKNANRALPLSAQAKVMVAGGAASLSTGAVPSFIETLSAGKGRLPFRYMGFAAGYEPESDKRNNELIAEACSLAVSSDVVLLFLGLDKESAAAAIEKRTLSLPANRLALADALGKTGKTIIGVISGDFPYDTSFDSDCHALLLLPEGGASTSGALLDILSGRMNPSGKLANTLYEKTDEFFAERKKQKDLGRVKVGPFFGYRYYDTAGIKVKYPFGHGLSYTRFSYSKLKVEVSSVRFKVKNSGSTAGFETVQVYFGMNGSSVARPNKELCGFCRVYLEPGQSRLIKMNIDYFNFAFCDSKDGERKVEGGAYTLYVGSSVSDVRLTKKFKVPGKKFNEVKENLSDYIPTATNIVSGRYTLEDAKKSKVSVPIFVFAALLVAAGLFDIYIAAFGGSLLILSILFIILNALVPVSIVGLIVCGRKLKRYNDSVVRLNLSDRENETALPEVLPLEKLFLDEFSEQAADERVKTQAAAVASSDELSAKTVAEQLSVFLSERGLAAEATTVRALLSAMAASRLIVLKSADSQLLPEFISTLSAFFGTAAYADALIGLGDGTDGALFYTVNSSGKAETAAAKAVRAAETDNSLVHIVAFSEAEFPKMAQLLSPVVNYAAHPEQERKPESEGKNGRKAFNFPSNVWLLLTLSQSGGAGDLPTDLAENAFVIDVKLRKVTAKDVLTPLPVVGCAQLLALGQRAGIEGVGDERLWKKLDMLEEFVASRLPYRIGNKEWRRMEKFVAVYLACEGTEAEGAELLINAKLLPVIAPLIKNSPSFEEGELSYALKKILGEEAAPHS